MNGSLSEPVGWSRKRWVYTLLAVLAAQTGLLVVLEKTGNSSSPRPPFRTAIYPVHETGPARQVSKLAFLQDPTLFALPTAHAFSDNAWLSYAPLEHEFNDWIEPPRWLKFNADQLGGTFAWFAQTVTNAPLRVADLPVLPLTGSDITVSNQSMSLPAAVFLEGDLRTRPLLDPLPAQAWSHPEWLSNTVVQVAVDAAGHPTATTLLARSGLPTADQYALQQSAQARFEALRPIEDRVGPDLRLTWGRLVFRWQTLFPTPTNSSVTIP